MPLVESDHAQAARSGSEWNEPGICLAGFGTEEAIARTDGRSEGWGCQSSGEDPIVNNMDATPLAPFRGKEC